MRNLYLKLALPFTLLIAAGEVTAQTGKTITFKETPASASKKGFIHSRRPRGKNMLTVSTLTALSGVTWVSYERVLNGSFTLGVGVGPTYRSWWMQTMDGAATNKPDALSGNHQGDRENISDDYGSFKHRSARPGFAVGVSPRYYPRHGVLDGGFLAPIIEYRVYRFGAFRADETPFVPATNDFDRVDFVRRSSQRVFESVKCLDLMAGFGGNFQMKNRLAIGYQVGLGIRTVRASRQDIGYVRLPTVEYQYTNDIVDYSESRFVGTINLSIGGWW